MTTQFKVGDRVRHFKGGEYVILHHVVTCCGFSEGEGVYVAGKQWARSATDIALQTECFVYTNVKDGFCWIRPCSEFGEMITRPRFEVVEGES